YSTVFPRCLVVPANTVKQYGMGLPDHPLAERQGSQHLLGVTHGLAVVENLLDIVALGFRQFGGVVPRLEFEHLAHGRLGALDTGRKHCFLGHERRQEHARVWQGPEQPVVARDRRVGRTEQWHKFLPAVVARGKLPGVVLDRVAHRSHPPSVSTSRRWSSAARASPSAALKTSTASASGGMSSPIGGRTYREMFSVQPSFLISSRETTLARSSTSSKARYQETTCSPCAGSRKFCARPFRNRVDASMINTFFFRA